MRSFPSLFCAAVVCGALLVLPTTTAEESFISKIMKKTRSVGQDNKAKRQRQDQAAVASSASRAMDSSLQMLRNLQSGKMDFFQDVLPQMMSNVSDAEVKTAFETFKVFKSSKAYKDFVASGATDAMAELDAMRQGMTEITQALVGIHDMMQDKDGLNNKLQDFVNLGQTDTEMATLFKNLQAGDASAVGDLQQRFANLYMGGLDLDAVNDVELLQKTRETMLANEDIMRIIGKGNPDVVEILKDPDLKPLKTGQFAQMEEQMARLAKKYGGTDL